MFDVHEITQDWLLDSSEASLWGPRRWFARRHLRRCAPCRGFALDLVEGLHGRETTDPLPAPDLGLLHASVMAAFERERRASKLMPYQPLPRRPGALAYAAVKAAGVALLVGLLIVFLKMPLTPPAFQFQDQNAQANPVSQEDMESIYVHESDDLTLTVQPAPTPSPGVTPY